MFGKMAVQSFAAIALLCGTAHAVEIETVLVGNPGNAADTRYTDSSTPDGFGAVGYEYNIGKYEVTNAQYVEFLNAVAATDTYGLYNSDMWLDVYGCKIERGGSSGSYSYSVTSDRANRPVNFVSWYDAARFCNWLTTGNTESGVYTFSPDGSVTSLNVLGPAWFIPTENEWYKAAYHKNDGATGDYWDYPTGTNSKPSNDLIDPDPGNNANFYDGSYTIGAPYYVTEVGEFENSESPYGTYDQGGNVWEWNETAIGSLRGLRGGRWASGLPMHASYRSYVYAPTHESGAVGFRVASISAGAIRKPGLPGDLNNDGVVNSRDLDLVRSWWGAEVEPGNGDRGDATGDGLVNSKDLDLVRSNWGTGTAAVPEASTVLLVLVGAVSLTLNRSTFF